MKTLTLILASLVFLISAGCTKVKPPITGRSDPYRADQVHYVQEDLKNQTAVSPDIRMERTEGGILKITVPIRATTNKTFSIDWRVTFFDSNGAPLPGSPTGWAAKTLNANTFEYLTTNSLSADAKQFQMDIRYSE